MKKILFILGVAGALLPSFASAAINYSRDGQHVTVSIDDFSDLIGYNNSGYGDPDGIFPYWTVGVCDYNGDCPSVISGWIPNDNLSVDYTFTLPAGDYSAVVYQFSHDGVVNAGGDYFEGDENSIIFSVADNPCSTSEKMSTDGLGCTIDGVNTSAIEYVGVLIAHYWYFVLGFIIIVSCVIFGKRIVSNLF